ncbi:MAG: UvrB/UvrC motif-containing protein, partial [Anaerolineales bacterium]|nr:UvrB/UvrC motif-containing protein [Anaerolineales bacterium]
MKAVRDITDELSAAAHAVAEPQGEYRADGAATMPKSELKRLINQVERSMKEAAKELEFEKAALLRDQLFELRKTLADESNLPPWERVKLMAGEE